MNEIQRIDRPGDRVTVRYLPDNQVALSGPFVEVERKVHAMQALDRLVGGPSEFVETGADGRVMTTIRMRPLEVAAPPSWYERPGLILTWVGSGCAAVLSIGYAVRMILGGIAGLATLLIGVAAVLVGGAVALKMVSGGGSSGTWKTN